MSSSATTPIVLPLTCLDDMALWASESLSRQGSLLLVSGSHVQLYMLCLSQGVPGQGRLNSISGSKLYALVWAASSYRKGHLSLIHSFTYFYGRMPDVQ